jgi:hypothetical protein
MPHRSLDSFVYPTSNSASMSITSDPHYPVLADVGDASSSSMSSKRSASGLECGSAESSSRKKAKKESETSDAGDGDREDADEESRNLANTERKVKATRGSRSVSPSRFISTEHLMYSRH